MVFFSYLAWLVIGAIIGFPIGILCVKFLISYQKTQDQNKMLKVIKGEVPNNLKLDGETYNVQKFIAKNKDGKIIAVEFGKEFKKMPSEALNKQKIGSFKTVLTKIRGLFKKNA